jgi:hypothetical protein
MFNLGILDVAIGLIVVYLQLSLICTALNELIASVLRRRSRNLWRGVRDLLGDPQGTGLAKTLYEHPFIQALHRGSSKPSYLPSRTFALALMDLVTTKADGQPGDKDRLLQLRTWAAGVSNIKVKRALLILIDEAQGDLVKARESIETWFNSSMDQVSGWYKQQTQWITLILGIIITLVANVDTVALINSLTRDPAARNALVAAAPELAKQALPPTPAAIPTATPTATPANAATGTPLASSSSRAASADDKPLKQEVQETKDKIDTIMKSLNSINLPIGWNFEQNAPPCPQPNAQAAGLAAVYCAPPWPGGDMGKWGAQMRLHFFGWLLTALAVSLGAPFWFDVLNKFIVVRSTVKPTEKSGKQPSKDEPPPEVEKKQPAADTEESKLPESGEAPKE